MTILRSMTGYGSAEVDWNDERVTIIVRSVNHRFLDTVFKLPPELRPMEQALRSLFKVRLSRGRVEVTVDVGASGGLAGVRLKPDAVGRLVDLSGELEAAGLAVGTISALDLLRFPDLFTSPLSGGGTARTQDVDAETARSSAILTCADKALDALMTSRAKEGSALEVNLAAIISDLSHCLDSIKLRSTPAAENLVERYRERLVTLVKPALEAGDSERVAIEFDDARLLQEAGILAERLDVSEEVERLGAHLEAVGSVVAAGGACGKRLDFLAQELLREINTIASKCRDSTVAALTVDAKVLCERFREQVQNVE